MILHSVHGRLTPNDCAIILMDYQPQLALAISSTNGETLIYNATNLANIARTFNIPTLLTTIGQTSFGGPIFSKLQEIFPDQKPIHRTTLSVFEDARILTILERIGRNKFVIGGLWTDFGVAASAEQARNLGYEVFVVVDACGDVSLRAHQIAIQRILDEGAVAITWLQMLLALHQDWAPPEAYKALLRIVRDHANAYGLEIQYAPPALDEGQTNGWITNQKKGGGKMAHSSDPITKKVPKKAVIKHHPEACLEDLMRGEFFNCIFKKNLLLSHEGPPKKQLFPSITG